MVLAHVKKTGTLYKTSSPRDTIAVVHDGSETVGSDLTWAHNLLVRWA